MQFTHAQAARLSATELQHYASLGMVPESTIAERMPDISDAIYCAATKELEAPAYDRGHDDGAAAERHKAAAIIRKLLQDVALMVPEDDRDGIYACAVREAEAYLNESES